MNPEILAIIVSGIGGTTGLLTIAYKKFIKPIVKLCKNQDFFIESVGEIKKELTTNGGSSLKDAIIGMKESCERIENRQRVIIQRTKAALHYSSTALFETDKEGRLIWSNVNLIDLTKRSNTWSKDANYMVEGFDWISLFKEEDRELVLSEFKSCLAMNRRFIKETELINGVKVRLLGYPYKITDTEHGGFLVSITEEKEV
tara:strand:+ start:6198 stop:6800 length:603 start_codon:yes stop_codon:yes gene_type:complete